MSDLWTLSIRTSLGCDWVSYRFLIWSWMRVANKLSVSDSVKNENSHWVISQKDSTRFKSWVGMSQPECFVFFVCALRTVAYRFATMETIFRIWDQRQFTETYVGRGVHEVICSMALSISVMCVELSSWEQVSSWSWHSSPLIECFSSSGQDVIHSFGGENTSEVGCTIGVNAESPSAVWSLRAISLWAWVLAVIWNKVWWSHS